MVNIRVKISFVKKKKKKKSHLYHNIKTIRARCELAIISDG